MSSNIVGIHQPNFFPWIGYFMKMKRCDTFIFLDDVQLNKESYTRRVKVRHPQKQDEDIWLTVPLMKHRHDTLICQLLVDHKKDWIGKHLEILNQAYGKSPAWSRFEEWVSPLYHSFREMEFLHEVNKASVQSVSDLLDINTRLIDARSLNVSGLKDEYTYRLVEATEGTAYVRGMGEQNYSRATEWTADDAPDIIDISTKDWEHEIKEDYPNHQVGLSVLDMIATMNEPLI